MEKPELFVTSNDNDHIHVIYKNANGEHEVYKSNGHIHFVRRIEATQIQLDNEGNVSREPQPERVEIEENEGHTHQLLQIVPKKKEMKIDKQDVVKEFYSLYEKARDISEDFVERASVAYNFYIGGIKQWCLDMAAAEKLKNSNRAVISTNEIQPIVDVLSGQQRQQRTAMKAYPTESGDPTEADIATTVLKHISQCNKLPKMESEIFKTTEITGRGDIGVEIKTVNSVSPEIKLTRDSYKDVFYGPHEESDLSDCEYVFKRKWVPYTTLKNQFPSMRKELESSHGFYSTVQRSGDDRESEVNGENFSAPAIVFGEPLYNKESRKYQVIKLERKVYRTIPIAVVEEDEMDNLYLSLEGVDSSILSAVKKANGESELNVIDHTKYVIEVVLMAGDTVLKHFQHEMPEFSNLPLYAKKEEGYVYGIVEPIIPHQREVNKRHCQAIDSTTYNNSQAWAYDDSTFVNVTEEQKFIARANDPSLVVKLNNTEKPPIKIQSQRNFQEPVAMLELSSQKMKSVSGVNMETLGAESNARSGIAIARRLRQGLVTNDYIFDNLSHWKEQLGRIILLYVQEYYSTDDIIEKILNRQNGKEGVKLNGQKYSDMNKEKVRSIIDNMDFTKYDIVISESAQSPTKAMDLLSALTELTDSGQLPQSPMITIDVLKNSGLIDPQTADKYMNEIRQQQDAAQSIEKGKQQTELNKTIIAKS